ncbi:hypothetical protein D3C83_25800 [compost metagenome]
MRTAISATRSSKAARKNGHQTRHCSPIACGEGAVTALKLAGESGSTRPPVVPAISRSNFRSTPRSRYSEEYGIARPKVLRPTCCSPSRPFSVM